MTNGTAAGRISEQARAAGVPEEPLILRVYRAPDNRDALELERTFHRLLDAAGHERSRTGSGREWFATTVEFLDTVADVLGLLTSTNG